MGKLDDQARARLLAWQKAQMTQAELGRRIGRDPVWVSRYLSWQYYDADLDTLQKMAEACGHTLYEVLDVLPSNDEGKLLAAYRRLPQASRATALSVVEAMSPPERKSTRRGG